MIRWFRCIFAFSKRKLCNGENFRIKDFDEFRCFWGSWVKIIDFKKMYVCMYCNGCMHYIVKSTNKYGMTRYLLNTPARIRTARRARWMIKSAPRGEKTKHRDKKASGADARRDVTRRPWLFRHLLNAHDCSATFFPSLVCSRMLATSMPPWLQPPCAGASPTKKERAVRRVPVEASTTARDKERERECDRPVRSIHCISSAGQPKSKCALYMISRSRAKAAPLLCKFSPRIAKAKSCVCPSKRLC